MMAALPVLLWAYAYGPDPGYVGVPGENGGATLSEVNVVQILSTVKLLVERFPCHAVKANHLKRYDRTTAALLWARFPQS